MPSPAVRFRGFERASSEGPPTPAVWSERRSDHLSLAAVPCKISLVFRVVGVGPSWSGHLASPPAAAGRRASAPRLRAG